jgi:hypothetical protein
MFAAAVSTGEYGAQVAPCIVSTIQSAPKLADNAKRGSNHSIRGVGIATSSSFSILSFVRFDTDSEGSGDRMEERDADSTINLRLKNASQRLAGCPYLPKALTVVKVRRFVTRNRTALAGCKGLSGFDER